jgi:hypothetical protein
MSKHIQKVDLGRKASLNEQCKERWKVYSGKLQVSEGVEPQERGFERGTRMYIVK